MKGPRADDWQPPFLSTIHCLSQLPLRSPLPPAVIRPERLDHVLHLRLELLRVLLPTRKVRGCPIQARFWLVWVFSSGD